MKKIILGIILLLAFFFGFLHKDSLTQVASNLVYSSPCDTPLGFKIGKIDAGFDVTSDTLIKDSQQAANIWNVAYGKKLLTYDPKAVLTINMVYDSRQALNSKIDQLHNNLKQQQGALDPEIQAYKDKQADFEKKLSSLNQEIDYWNARGGAPQEEYKKLINQQNELKAEADELNNEAVSLGQATQQYNLNVDNLSSTINDYQKVLNVKPEEGVYEQNGDNKSISIFIDTNKNEFLHTLAHEMGHALGLSHNTNPNSIMYAQTTSTTTPTQDDLNALEKVCRKRTIFETVYNNISMTISYFANKGLSKFQ
jgi:chaperonin cofactor prefoldin